MTPRARLPRSVRRRINQHAQLLSWTFAPRWFRAQIEADLVDGHISVSEISNWLPPSTCENLGRDFEPPRGTSCTFTEVPSSRENLGRDLEACKILPFEIRK